MPPRDRTKRRLVPRQERARASVEAILVAAEQLLAEEGFQRLTTNRLAARAGVNVALVYRYFAGKEAIVGALVERVAERRLLAVRNVLAEHAEAPLPTAVRALLGVLIETPGVDSRLHREVVEQLDLTKRRGVLKDMSDKLAILFAELLARHAAEIRPLQDPQALLFVLQHAGQGAAHAAAFYRPSELDPERVLDALTDVMLRALLPIP